MQNILKFHSLYFKLWKKKELFHDILFFFFLCTCICTTMKSPLLYSTIKSVGCNMSVYPLKQVNKQPDPVSPRQLNTSNCCLVLHKQQSEFSFLRLKISQKQAYSPLGIHQLESLQLGTGEYHHTRQWELQSRCHESPQDMVSFQHVF